ncbi:GTP-sensing transcriptional pleiotropic repressor CodY [Candidatus Syntrophocurvum alkaliphilum]|uniref:Global transcriptional regulator CodY n=1 Tax=Candidatus Syntrophocurvum alkaliphilum TaxID=2293317 RepID=A0A6I6DFB1_9FIRM|nr:GTP-sensing transcriptional pleiotropic repressor CodY [Candidatus Syntrophocurvum alkaliphilum]
MNNGILKKSRAINKILQKIAGNPVDFFEMASVLSMNLECGVFIVGRRGQIIGYAFNASDGCTDIDNLISHAERFPESFNQDLIYIQETKTNVVLDEGRKCIFNVSDDSSCMCSSRIWSIVPVFGGARRIGTLIITRATQNFSDEDIVLAEYGAIVVANEVMRMRAERIEEDARKKASVQIAIATLSYSEKEAIDHILAELDGNEGLLVASRIADKVELLDLL